MILIPQGLGTDEGLLDGKEALASKRPGQGLSVGKEEAVDMPVYQARLQGLHILELEIELTVRKSFFKTAEPHRFDISLQGNAQIQPIPLFQAQRSTQFLVILTDLRHTFIKTAACLRQGYAAVFPAKERTSQLPFEVCNIFGHRRTGQALSGLQIR